MVVWRGHRVCNSLLFCLGRAVRHIGQNAEKHLLALGRDGKFDADGIKIDAGDRIGDEVEVDLIKQRGRPDRAVESMGIRRRVEGHVEEFPDLVGPCCRKGKVIRESGEREGEDDCWERRFRCQTQEHILFVV